MKTNTIYLDTYDAKKTKSGRKKIVKHEIQFTRAEMRKIRLCPHRIKYRRNSTFFCTLNSKPFLKTCLRQRP